MADAGFTHAAGADIPHSATSRRCQVPHHPAVVDQQLAPRLQAVDLRNSHDVDHGFHCRKLSQHMPHDP